MEEGNRFEEVDDAFLEEWADSVKEERDCSFAKMYGPIRALFATDSVVLSKFEDCLDHMERLSFLLNMEVSWVFGFDIQFLPDEEWRKVFFFSLDFP